MRKNPFSPFSKSPLLLLLPLLAGVVSACAGLGGPSAYERVADSYAAPADSLKRRAADFLAAYAPYHYGTSRTVPEGVDATPYLATHDTLFRQHLDSCGYSVERGERVLDTDTVTEDFLRENIDLAFDSWRQPWARGVGFDDFCRYILPYRNGDEPLSRWRRYFKEKYEPTIADSVADPTSLRQVAQYLMRCIRREVAYGPRTGEFCQELLDPQSLERLHWMGCRNGAHYTTLAMRACGVPCQMIDIHWRFTEVTHSSVLFPAVGSNKRAFRLTLGDPLMEMGAAKDSMATWRTWATTYEANPRLLHMAETSQKGGGRKALLQLALPVTREDVTAQLSRAYDFALPVPDTLRREPCLLLCRFYQWRWRPVREGEVRGDSVYFRDATIRQCYRLGCLRGDTVQAFGTPFTLTGDTALAAGQSRLRPFDLKGDTVFFKRVYGCKPDETRLTRRVTTYYWDASNRWHPYRGEAVLWGLNEETGEYRVFSESLRGRFKPVFHLLTLRLPCHTLFTDDETPRLLGYIATDPMSGEGYMMEF